MGRRTSSGMLEQDALLEICKATFGTSHLHGGTFARDVRNGKFVRWMSRTEDVPLE